MKVQDLRKLLEETEDKLTIFVSLETLKKYSFSNGDLLNLINEFLTDEEKLKLFDYSHFQRLDEWIKSSILKQISDPNMQVQMLYNDNTRNALSTYQIIDIIKNLGDNEKTQILQDKDFLEKSKIKDYDIKNIISTLEDEAKLELLEDVEFITNGLALKDYQITELIKEITSEENKIKLLGSYSLEAYSKVDIIKTLNDNNKIEIVLNEEFDRYFKIDILTSLDSDSLYTFLSRHKEFCTKNNIRPFEIIKKFNTENQKKFIEKLEQSNLTQDEKLEIYAILKQEVKDSINVSELKEEYKTAISMKTNEFNTNIVLDLDRNLEDYRGLDNLIKVQPEILTEEEKTRLLQLCDICPNMQVVNLLNDTVEEESTATEYKDAEKWITDLINNLKPEYSDIQKLAVIDNAIGRKISYSPDFDTEVFDADDCRALWKIISSGYGVCNGVANVEKYILKRVGIESEMISSGKHTFLRIKNIELPLANGETIKGDTIVDPTWNLAEHRFGGYPNNFCISYEEARKNDIGIDGKDYESHRNDEKLQDVTLSLEEQCLRNLFKSVGLADEQGQFPMKDLVEKSEMLHQIYENQPNENIKKQFLLLSQVCPEFVTCQNSTMGILSNILLKNEKLKFSKCVVNRVYNKEDKEKRPNLYVYIDLDELGKRFYYADKSTGQFVQLSQEEFTQQFECYQEDLNLSKGVRPWETKEQFKEEIDLSKSSGTIIAKEEEER